MCDYKILLFCVSTILIHLPTGSCLRCGVCTSELNLDCKDPTKVTKFEECNQKQEFVCRTLEYYLKAENTVHVTRGCVQERDGSNNEACSRPRTLFYAKVNKCETCKTDLCNVDQSLKVNVKQAGFREEVYAIPNPGGSVALRSSFLIVILSVLFSSYKKYVI